MSAVMLRDYEISGGITGIGDAYRDARSAARQSSYSGQTHLTNHIKSRPLYNLVEEQSLFYGGGWDCDHSDFDLFFKVDIWSVPVRAVGGFDLAQADLDYFSSVDESRAHATAAAQSITVDETKSVMDAVYQLEAAGRGREASRVIFEFVVRRLRDLDAKPVEKLLVSMDFDKLSPHSLAGVIRVTASLRDYFPNSWRKRHMDARARVAALNRNPEKVFVGIPDA